MARTRSQSKEGSRAAQAASSGHERWTQIAFVLAMALVLARATMKEYTSGREMDFSDAPREAGAAAGLGLDLLCCLPAMLVLARRVMDRQYVLRWSWAVAPMALLAVWGALSTFWAADKFAALCAGFHLIGAAALLWAGVQLVRSWLRLRMVAAILFGLLLAYFMFSLFYKLVDAPSTAAYYKEHRDEILKKRGMTDPFAIKQFENKVAAGELIGFFGSPNSMAAVVVLLLVISLGLGAQRIMDDPKDAMGIGILAIAVALGGWMIVAAKSKTAAVTPVLALAAIGAGWRWRAAIAHRAVRLYWLGVAAAAVAAAAVIGHGLFHHGLPGTSLTFRWNYWVGAIRIFAKHPLAGVGLENFGLYYLGARLPVAAEEVKDPHNFLVKCLTELGIIGALCCIAWIGRMSWELTRPIAPMAPLQSVAKSSATGYRGPRVIVMLAIIVMLAMLINVMCSVDFHADSVYVLNVILEKIGMFALLLIGASIAAIKSLAAPELDSTPAPLLLYAMLAALLVFFVHNLIDFSISEPGAMMLFAWVAACALGVRQPSVAGLKRRTAAAAVALLVCVLVWLIAGGFVWAPTVAAADSANDAAIALRTNRASEAMRLFSLAHERQPLNADYAFKAAEAGMSGQNYNPIALDLLQMAIRGNPLEVSFYLARARYLMQSPEAMAHKEEIKKDLQRAVELNPNDVSTRVEFADALASFKAPQARAEAIMQYQEALKFNELLKEDEPKRLRGDRLEGIKKKLGAIQTTQP